MGRLPRSRQTPVTRYRIPDGLMMQTVKDESVILDPDTGTYFTLNDVGTRMLQLFRDHGDIEAVVATITDEFDVDAASAHNDLQQLLNDLSTHGLAEPLDH